jgi:hypothetical protein
MSSRIILVSKRRRCTHCCEYIVNTVCITYDVFALEETLIPVSFDSEAYIVYKSFISWEVLSIKVSRFGFGSFGQC